MTEPKPNWPSMLQKVISRWEVVLSSEMTDCFDVYLQELRQWNEKINLTALHEPEHIALGHFADSLAPLMLECVYKAKHIRAVDIGTGAGFPGLPLKIVSPTWHMSLIESTNKKCDFLRALVGVMELSRVEIFGLRAEEMGRDPQHRETYDFAFARALSNLSTLIEYALPLLKVGGYLITHRGRTAAEEASRVNMALDELGGVMSDVHHYDIPEIGGNRALVVVRKVQATSKHYPRRIGVAAKRPL